MPPPIRKYDALGFPIPATFDDLQMPDRDMLTRPVSPAPIAAPKRRAGKRKRIVLGLILLGIVLLAAVPWLKDVGAGLLGDWLAQRAREKFVQGDMPGTIADSTRAFSLLGDHLNDERRIELLVIRAMAKMELNDLEGSRGDFDRVLTSPITDRVNRIRSYLGRSWVHCRQKNYAAAVEDASAAIEFDGPDHVIPFEVRLNQRAYIRALANAEKRDKQDLRAGLKDVDAALTLQPENAAFIDTRGYLLYLLGEYHDALSEMKRAIALTEFAFQRVYRAEDSQKLREDLAVMYYHRGLVREALGEKLEADSDFRLAQEFGYNPEAGVL
jgi:tetratricopeptide (TPR) repeat protein